MQATEFASLIAFRLQFETETRTGPTKLLSSEFGWKRARYFRSKNRFLPQTSRKSLRAFRWERGRRQKARLSGWNAYDRNWHGMEVFFGAFCRKKNRDSVIKLAYWRFHYRSDGLGKQPSLRCKADSDIQQRKKFVLGFRLQQRFHYVRKVCALNEFFQEVCQFLGHRPVLLHSSLTANLKSSRTCQSCTESFKDRAMQRRANFKLGKTATSPILDALCCIGRVLSDLDCRETWGKSNRA